MGQRPRLHLLNQPSALARYFAPDCLARLETAFDVTREPGPGSPDSDTITRRLAEVDAVMVGWGAPALTPENLAGSQRLKLVACFGGSITALSPQVGWARGLTYLNCAAGMVDAMAEATLGMILALGYQFPTADRRMRLLGDFSHHYPLSVGLTGKTVGIVGLGHIGRRVAEVLTAFRCHLLGYDPFFPTEAMAALGLEPSDSLDTMLPRCQVLTIHAGWNDATTGLISRERLALLPDGAILVNNARLPIVDEEALLDEVKRGRLQAALNLIPARPELYGDETLRDLTGLLYTSGATNVSDVYARGMSQMLTDDLLRWARGEQPRQIVTPEWVERTT